MNALIQAFPGTQTPGMPRTRLGLLAIAALGSLLGLSSCATTGPQTIENKVESRSQARWDAVLARDYDNAYAMYSPGYRSAHSRVDFEIEMRTRRVVITAAQVEQAVCEGDACTVAVQVDFVVAAPLPGVPKLESKRRIEERWIRTEGEWWYVPET